MLTPLHFPRKERPRQLGERGKILGSFKCKNSEGGKWKYDHFPDMKSRAHQDSIMIFSRIVWTSFTCFPWTVFPGDGGNRNGKRHSYDLYPDGCQHKLGSHFFSLSFCKSLLHKKSHYTFTTSKDHSHFYHTHFREGEPGKRVKLEQPFKTIKWGWCVFKNQSE